MLTIITLLTFGSIALFAIALTMKSERAIIHDRVVASSQLESTPGSSVESDSAKPFRERILLPMLGRLSGMGARITPSGAHHAIETKLVRAGRPWGIGVREFLGFKVLSIAVFLLLGFGVIGFFHASGLLRILLFIILTFVGFILPNFLLERAAVNRQLEIRRVLPDTLDMLIVSVEAGLGLDGAMQRVVERFDNPLAVEMGRALQEMRVGALRIDALRNMANRVDVPELTSFVAAICQADELGVSISNVLRVQGETLRTSRSQRAKETAGKLPVKMLFPLIFFIFPAIFVVVLAPAAIRIAHAFGIF